MPYAPANSTLPQPNQNLFKLLLQNYQPNLSFRMFLKPAVPQLNLTSLGTQYLVTTHLSQNHKPNLWHVTIGIQHPLRIQQACTLLALIYLVKLPNDFKA